MSPTDPLWEAVAAPYRAGDLHECVRLTRLAVDEQPYVLLPRYLLASLYLSLREPGLALLQYERLLPLAVGRGELFAALAAQRRLDELHPQGTLHARRYHAMHQWFVSLARAGRRGRGGDGPDPFGPRTLVRMPAPEFAAVAERCAVETLELAERESSHEGGVLWVVLHGRVRWSAAREDGGGRAEGVAEPGDLIALAAPGATVRCTFEALTPAECLRLDPVLLAEACAEPAADAAAPPAATPVDPVVEEQIADLVAAASADGPAGARAAAPPATPTGARPAPAPAVRRARVPRPVPDPIAEPVVAVGAPIERRRETRLSVSIANRVALLGLAGTRVAPLPGALLELSVEGLSVRFRRGDLLQMRRTLTGSVIGIHLTLPGSGPALRLAGRVAWVDPPQDGRDPEDEMRMGLELLAVGPTLRARLERLIGPAARAA